jgi:hypothetical protein
MPRSGSVGNEDGAHPVGKHSNALNSACPGASSAATVGLMIYLDHNATTPVLPGDSSFFILTSAFPEEWGNPSSAYKFGSKLKGVIETARACMVEPPTVTFTHDSGCRH